MQGAKGKRIIFFVFGKRPEAIKLAPIIKELQACPNKWQPRIVITAQHREMLDQVLELFEIKQDYDLNIMSSDQTLFDISVRSLRGFEEILLKEQPEIIVVQGDTTSALMGALAAFYCQIPVGHVEAGLRSFEKYRPFPEEMNRKLISHIADIHFAPTQKAADNLINEGIRKENIYITGNTVVDAFMSIAKQRRPYTNPVLEAIDFEQHRVVLVTAHRRENWGSAMAQICKAILSLTQKFGDVIIVFSVHKNPKVRKTVNSILGGKKRIYLIEPIEYASFCRLMSESYLILTDSGGIQEEAPSLGKPVLVLRDVTERPEGIEAGTVRLVGTNTNRIIEEASKLLSSESEYQAMAKAVNPYGDGKASKRIVQVLEDRFSG